MSTKRVGFCITGGGARLAQQAALCKYLIEERGKVPQIISGTSVGGLIAVAVDCILAGRWSWSEFDEVLFSLQNKDVYRQRSVTEIARLTAGRKLSSLFDAQPERMLFRKLLSRIGISTVADLKLPLYICAVENETGKEVFWDNINGDHSHLMLEDILLATSSVAFKFEPVPVPSPDGPYYVDGAEGRHWAPIYPLLKHSLDEIYIITPATYTVAAKIDSNQLADNTLAAISYLVKAVMELQLDYYPRANPQTDYFLVQPVLDKRFGPMDFESGKEEYQLVWDWIGRNFVAIEPLSKEWPPKHVQEILGE